MVKVLSDVVLIALLEHISASYVRRMLKEREWRHCGDATWGKPLRGNTNESVVRTRHATILFTSG